MALESRAGWIVFTCWLLLLIALGGGDSPDEC